MNFRNSQPFVGPSAFAHKGGMHVHAVNRAASSYEHIAPERGRQRTPHPGERTVRPLEHHRADHQAQPAARQRADGPRSAAGRRAGEPRLPVRGGRGVVRSAGPARWPARSRPTSSCCSTTSTSRPTATARPTTEATVKLRVGDERAARGGRGRRPGERPRRGPAEGAQRALSRTCRHAPGRLQGPRHQQRSRHRRRACASSSKAATTTRNVWGTVGVSENVIEASWDALVDSIEYKLCKDSKRC